MLPLLLGADPHKKESIMAQNECQQMTKVEFYQSLRNVLSTTYNMMSTLERASGFLNAMDAETLNNMTVPATGADEGLRVTLAQCRTAINETLAFYNGTATTQTQVLKDNINKLRQI